MYLSKEAIRKWAGSLFVVTAFTLPPFIGDDDADDDEDAAAVADDDDGDESNSEAKRAEMMVVTLHVTVF